MYYVILEDLPTRTKLITYLKEQGVNSVFHYVPLHSSPAGRQLGRNSGNLDHTENLSERILRLPLFPGLVLPQVEKITKSLQDFYAL
jgi:dTDP-4-amino-4,6-dideoxygalactose transaminase